jgi:hypothetical protein
MKNKKIKILILSFLLLFMFLNNSKVNAVLQSNPNTAKGDSIR